MAAKAAKSFGSSGLSSFTRGRFLEVGIFNRFIRVDMEDTDVNLTPFSRASGEALNRSIVIRQATPRIVSALARSHAVSVSFSTQSSFLIVFFIVVYGVHPKGPDPMKDPAR